MTKGQPSEAPPRWRGGARHPPAAILLAFLVLAGDYLSRPGLAWDESLQVPTRRPSGVVRRAPRDVELNAFYDSLGRFTSHPPLAEYAMAATTETFGNSMSRLYAARVASVASMAVLLAAVYFFTLHAADAAAVGRVLGLS